MHKHIRTHMQASSARQCAQQCTLAQSQDFAPQTIIITITDPPAAEPKLTTARGAADGSGEAWSRR